MQIEMIADYACNTGENPLWHAAEKKLYWTDIPAGKLFRYDPATGKHEQFYEDRPVGGFTFQADGALLLFRDKGNIVRWHNGKITDTLIDALPEESDHRFNDVAADVTGRVFCGTLGKGGGRLYRLDTDGSITKLLDDIKCSNGIGWTLDLKTMYYTDSGVRTIYTFDYDREHGSITNQKPWVVVEGKELPDGMTVDANGDVWSARWDGFSVVRHTPDGKEAQRIKLPTGQVSSVIFGGEDLTDMYLTTAGGHEKDQRDPQAGALFRIASGVKGQPEPVSRIGMHT